MSATSTTIRLAGALVLLAVPRAILADPPKCDVVQNDPSIFTCTCLKTDDEGNLVLDANGNPIRVPTPDRCGDMLGGQRTIVRTDDLLLADPQLLNTSPLEWVSQTLTFQTMPNASDPNRGDFVTTGIKLVSDHPGCDTGLPPNPQRTQVGRPYDLKSDFVLVLTAINGVTTPGCAPSGADDNLEIHVYNPVTRDEVTALQFSAPAEWVQMAVADFDLDGLDDVFVLAADRIIVGTAEHPSMPSHFVPHTTPGDFTAQRPLNEPTVGDFNGDGNLDVAWVGGAVDAADSSQRGDLSIFMVTVCPGDVEGDPLCEGRSAFDVVLNPAAGLAPTVPGATSTFSLQQVPGAKANSATLNPSFCGASAGGIGGAKQSLRASAVVLGNFDESNGLGATGLPIDELVVAFVSGDLANSSDPCLIAVWYLTYSTPTASHPSWVLPVATNTTNLFPEANTLPDVSVAGLAFTLFARAAQLEWLSGPEQAIIGVGGGPAKWRSATEGIEQVFTSYTFPVTVSIGTDQSTGETTLVACGAPDRSKSKPSGDLDEMGTRYPWGMAVGRFTTTQPAANTDPCGDPTNGGECPYDLQIATFAAEFDGFTGAGNEMKLWSLEPSSGSHKCANDGTLATSFVPVSTVTRSIDFNKLVPGWDRAGSQLQVGDFAGTSIRVGEPTIVRTTSHSQPLAILQAPPTHIDFVPPAGGGAATLLNLSAAPEQFNTEYVDMTSTSEGATHQTTSSTSFSNTVTLGAKYHWSDVPYVATVTVQDQFSFSYAHDTNHSQSLGQYESQSFSLNAETGIRDAVRWQEFSMNVFHYPVLGSATCPGEIVCGAADANNGTVVCEGDVAPQDAIVLPCEPVLSGSTVESCTCQTMIVPTVACPTAPASGTTCSTDPQGNACCAMLPSPMNYVLSGPEEITANTSPGSVLEWYQPVSASGQLFSYPASSALAALRFGRTQSTDTPPANALVKPQEFDTGSGEAVASTQWQCTTKSSGSIGSANNFSFDNSFSLTAGTSDEVLKTENGGQVSISDDLSYSTSHSTLDTSTFTHVDSTGVQINIQRDRFLTPLEDYSYGFSPLVYGAGTPPTVLDDPPTKVCPADDIDCDTTQQTATDCKESGPLIVAYAGSLEGQENSWWGSTYVNLPGQNGFDLALANPERWQITTTANVDPDQQFNVCRGVQPALECAYIQPPSAPPTDPANPTAQEVNDIWTNSFYSLRGLLVTVNSALGPQRNAAMVGDTVFLRLRIFDFSLADFPAGTTAYARFYRQKVDPTFDKDGDVIGLQSYVGPPVVVPAADGSDAVAFTPPGSFGPSSENFVLAETSYLADATQADSYWIFWVTVWVEDGDGNVLSELASHGLDLTPGTGFSRATYYGAISAVPLEMTADGLSFSNNVGMFKQTFYVAPQTPTGVRARRRPRADALEIRGLRAEPAMPRLSAPVEVAADVFSLGAATDAVTVLLKEANAGSAGLVLEAEKLPHIRTDSSHFFRKALRFDRCGPVDLVAEATARNGQRAVATTSLVVPCELTARRRKGGTRGLGTRRPDRRARLRLQASFAGQADVDLSRALLTVEHLLDERGGHELVPGLSAPVELHPAPGARPRRAVFANPEGTLRVAVRRKARRTKIRVRGTFAQIDAPIACAGRPRRTRLGTSIVLDDGSHAPFRLYLESSWRCRRNGRLRL